MNLYLIMDYILLFINVSAECSVCSENHHFRALAHVMHMGDSVHSTALLASLTPPGITTKLFSQKSKPSPEIAP